MKRFWMLVGVAVIAGAMYVAAAPGSRQATGPTARQFAALKKQVATLKKDEGNVKKLALAEAVVLVACLQTAVPIDQFGDGTNHTEGYRYAMGTPPTDTLETALDAADPTDPTAVFFVGGDSTCATTLSPSSTSSTSLRRQAALAGLQLSHTATQHVSFAAHR